MLPEEYVIKSNALFTANEHEPHPGYVYVEGNEIVEVGTLEELEEHPRVGVKVIDVGDNLVMPGFNDAHMHFALASVQHDPDYCVDLLFAESERACLDRVRDFDETHPGDGWIYGWGWYSAVWDNPIDPSKEGLDSLGIDRPICLDDFSMHVAWLNSKALEMVGITKNTPDPEGGIIRRDDEGNPTGILCEPAATDIANNVVLNVPDLKASLLKSMKRLNSLGITSVGDMHPLGVANEGVYETYQQIADNDEATLRISFFPDMTDVEAAKAERAKHHGDMVRCGGLKLISDEAVEAYTAYMAEPYLNAPEGPGYRGECVYSQDELDEIVDRAVAAGFNPRIHAIGDGAASMILNSYEKALAKYGRKGTRYCIEHGDNFKAEDIERLADLNGCFAIQPQHPIGGFPEGLYPIILGKERTSHMWRYREMLDGGITLGLSTDWPAVMSINPIDTVYAAVTRSDFKGNPPEGYYRNNALTLGEALQSHTQGSAYIEGFESRIGTLEEGKLADIVVLDCNPFELDIMDLRKASVAMTIFNGRVVYEKN